MAATTMAATTMAMAMRTVQRRQLFARTSASLHSGHALNKILKHIVNRHKWSCRKKAAVSVTCMPRIHPRHPAPSDMVALAHSYMPGWDCHGLPIELKATQSLQQVKELSRGSSAAVGGGHGKFDGET
ncbi:hypothetical protein CF326_g1226 [Tilletia indica]|nr:hypothetical protein CF326_g1226 [Tilletia indica]